MGIGAPNAYMLAKDRSTIRKILRFRDLPYNPFRTTLYTISELMKGYNPSKSGKSLDERIAKHYKDHNMNLPDVHEALAQRIHDHAIDEALYRFAKPAGKPGKEKKIVGIMGGHGMLRTDLNYKLVAQIAWDLVRKGFSIVTGGGPGAMEAANLGAYLAGHNETDLDSAIMTLSQFPSYPSHEPDYIRVATDVRKKYSDSGESLAIPTWAYSAEPTGQFSSRIGKYFSNSIREDGLLAIAAWGVIFAPGAAGTLQEIFQDIAHNSYWSFHSRGPLVFLDEKFYKAPPSIFDVVLARAKADKYDQMIGIFSDRGDIVQFILDHPMVPEKPPAPLRTYGLSNIAYL